MVELGGIEPPSISRWAPVIRLFPFCCYAATPTGRLLVHAVHKSRYNFLYSHRSFTTSSVFPNVIPRFCCRAAVNWPRATLRLTVALCHGLGGESELLVGSYFFAPFYESEQLESHARTSNLTSKPVSPFELT